MVSPAIKKSSPPTKKSCMKPWRERGREIQGTARKNQVRNTSPDMLMIITPPPPPPPSLPLPPNLVLLCAHEWWWGLWHCWLDMLVQVAPSRSSLCSVAEHWETSASVPIYVYTHIYVHMIQRSGCKINTRSIKNYNGYYTWAQCALIRMTQISGLAQALIIN